MPRWPIGLGRVETRAHRLQLVLYTSTIIIIIIIIWTPYLIFRAGDRRLTYNFYFIFETGPELRFDFS